MNRSISRTFDNITSENGELVVASNSAKEILREECWGVTVPASIWSSGVGDWSGLISIGSAADGLGAASLCSRLSGSTQVV